MTTVTARLVGSTAVMVAGLVACGDDDDGIDTAGGTSEIATTDGSSSGDDTDTDDTDTDDGQQQPDGADTSPDLAGGSAAHPDGPGAKRAVVTIGDETFEFSITYCTAMGGVIHGSDHTDDGLVRLDIEIPTVEPDSDTWDYFPPNISLEDTRAGDPGTRYMADAEWLAESGVDAFTVEGSRATGTATFVPIDMSGLEGPPVEPVSGAFDIDCGS